MDQWPEIEKLGKDVLAFDRPSRKWRPGERRDVITVNDVEVLTWTNTGANTDVAPDTDKYIDTLFARLIVIQIDSTHESNTSTDIDINIEATVDGSAWDTIPYAERNIGDAQRKTFLVTGGPRNIRLRLDNNAAATTAYVTARVLVVK